MASRKSPTPKRTRKPDTRPFVVDMRSDETSDPGYAVCGTWEEALARAGKFWQRESEHSFLGLLPREKLRQAFRAGTGYDEGDVYVTGKRGHWLYVTFAGGEGATVRVFRAEAPKTKPRRRR